MKSVLEFGYDIKASFFFPKDIYKYIHISTTNRSLSSQMPLNITKQ